MLTGSGFFDIIKRYIIYTNTNIKMKILKVLGVSLLGFSLITGLFIYFAWAAEANETNAAPYRYKVISQSEDPLLDPTGPGFLKVTIQNVGQNDWPLDNLYLGSIFFDGAYDRVSRFATSEWTDGLRIHPGSAEGEEEVPPRGRVSFDIPIQIGRASCRER